MIVPRVISGPSEPCRKTPARPRLIVMDCGFLMNVCAAGSHSIGRSVKILNASPTGAGTRMDLRTSGTTASVAAGSVMPDLLDAWRTARYG